MLSKFIHRRKLKYQKSLDPPSYEMHKKIKDDKISHHIVHVGVVITFESGEVYTKSCNSDFGCSCVRIDKRYVPKRDIGFIVHVTWYDELNLLCIIQSVGALFMTNSDVQASIDNMIHHMKLTDKYHIELRIKGYTIVYKDKTTKEVSEFYAC